MLKLLGNGQKFGSAKVRPNFRLCRKLLCLLFVGKFGRTSAEPKVRSITKKNPQFKFSSQDLSIEHNFFKWAVKVTKILHLLFCFGCKNFKINWHLMAISGPIVLTNSNLVSINYLIRERNQWLFTFSDTIRFYILFLTLLCFGGKNRPPDGFIIYLWHQNPQHSLFLLTFSSL